VKNKILLFILIGCFSMFLSACEKTISESQNGSTTTEIEATELVDSHRENSECEETPIYKYGYINANGKDLMSWKTQTMEHLKYRQQISQKITEQL